MNQTTVMPTVGSLPQEWRQWADALHERSDQGYTYRKCANQLEVATPTRGDIVRALDNHLGWLDGAAITLIADVVMEQLGVSHVDGDAQS